MLISIQNIGRLDRSELLSAVDNLSILSLDIAWCYLHLHAVSELPDAEARLLRCEQSFKQSYGQNLERLTALKGSPGSEQGLLARLHLLQVTPEPHARS